jgi:cytochrome b subunit of formate dehydrogenase
MAEQKGSNDHGKDALARLEREIEENLLRQIKAKLDGGVSEETKALIREKLRDRVREEIKEHIDRITQEVAADVLAPEKERAKVVEEAPPEKEEEFLRLGLNVRIQHMFLFTSVIILIITGLPLRFAAMNWSETVIHLFGGIENSRLIHRIGATGLMGVAIYHMLYTVFSKQGRRDFLLLLPMPKDVLDVFAMIKHFLGRSEERPKFGRYSYIEKFDYWAVYWGCVIMIGSGLILWFQDFSLRFLPKFGLDITKEAHRDEALLATLAIVIWHFYNVHFNPDKFPGSLTWLTGKISKHEMMEEHPLEYEEIMAAREKSGDMRDKEKRQAGEPSDDQAISD